MDDDASLQTKSKDNETTKVRNNESTKQRKCETAKQRKYETKKQEKYETTKVRNNESTKQRKYETILNLYAWAREETYVVSLNLNTRAGFEPAITECPSKFKN